MRHPNIVFIHGAMVDAQQHSIALVLELVQGQPLTDFMGVCSQQQNLPDLCSRYQVCLGVCRAFFYLHTRKPTVVHGDLKSSNILVEGYGSSTKPKLLDFGLARVLTRHAKPLGGTLSWIAPEVFCRGQQRPRCSADIFSLGMLLYFVATLQHPRKGMTRSDIKHALRSAEPASLEWPLDYAFQPYCKTLVESCIQLQEHLRPSANEVYVAISSWSRTDEPLAQARGDAIAAGGFANVNATTLGRPSAGSDMHRTPAPQQPHGPVDGACERPEILMVDEDIGAPGPMSFRLPSLMGTNEQTMATHLIYTTLRWNYQVPHGYCCKFHAHVAFVMQVCSKLNGGNCIAHDFWEDPPIQCPHCGLLCDTSDVPNMLDGCDFCRPRTSPALMQL